MEKRDITEEIVEMESTEKCSYIDENGNVAYRDGSNKVYLAVKTMSENGIKLNRVTKDYYYMEQICDDDFDDHYIVGDVVTNHLFDFDEVFDSSKFFFQFGVIALQRDENKNIIPMGEKVVVPILYDDIAENNLQTVTAQVDDHLTYIDINPNSENYGKQLVPVVLEHAVPFSVDYEGFAECSVCGVTGYLPRECKPRTSLNPLELLTEEQVKYLLPRLESSNSALHESSINKYSELTGDSKILKFIRK